MKPIPGRSETCNAMADILNRIGDKWSVMIVGYLSQKTMRFNELRHTIGGISQRMLTLTLKGLEQDGMVNRTMYPTIPPRVDYELTPLGRSLLEPLRVLFEWAVAHQAEVDAARQAFERLAAEGVPAAQYDLAMMHLRDEMPRPSKRSALRLLTEAAEQGFVRAMFELGRLHEPHSIAGTPDPALAVQWYRRAAEAGSVDAQVAIGTAYYLGRGVRKDFAEAARWFREAAKGGDVGTQYLLASMYEAGDGVSQDLRLARYWYGIAAKNGDIAAPAKVKQLDAQLAEPDPTTPSTKRP